MYSNEIEMSGLQYIDENFVKPQNPFKDVIKSARLKAGLSTIQVAEQGKFYGKVNHGGSVANWENGDNIPTIEQWETLSKIIPLGDYESVKQKYEALRNEYEIKRRPFNNFKKLFDVMRFDQEAHITGKYDHDTCKPETLTRVLILTCSRPDDLVLVPFAGSGTEVAMAIKEGRKAIGYDIEKKYVDMANRRVDIINAQPSLFCFA
jgi:site-specific DNA-methyltransferase (adenine-specific)